MREPLAIVLSSPHFLYLSEPTAAGSRRLDDGEFATRLAYFLWGGPPDDALVEAAADAVAPGTLQPLVVPGTMAPRATDRVQALLNLDSTKPVISRDFSPPFDARDANTYHDAFGLGVYDATGRSSYLVLYFTKVAEERWEIRARLGVNGTDAVGELAFDPNGNLPATTQPWAVTLSSAELTLPLTLHIDFTGTTQYAAGFSAATPQQPGYPYGTLMGLDIGYDGQVRALYNNGQSRDMARIPLARFDGSETFVSTAQGWRQATGAAPLMAWPGLQTTGALRTGALETDARLRTAAGQ